MKSSQGAGLYIIENANNKKATDTVGKYLIKNSNISNTSSTSGAAIFINNAQYLSIENGFFKNNSVTNSSDETLNSTAGSGGAVFYQCD